MGDDYYQNNKEHIKQLVRDRYANKKEQINKKITCDFCGRTVIARMYKKHTETNIHKKGKKQIKIINPIIELKTKKKLHNGIITFK